MYKKACFLILVVSVLVCGCLGSPDKSKETLLDDTWNITPSPTNQSMVRFRVTSDVNETLNFNIQILDNFTGQGEGRIPELRMEPWCGKLENIGQAWETMGCIGCPVNRIDWRVWGSTPTQVFDAENQTYTDLSYSWFMFEGSLDIQDEKIHELTIVITAKDLTLKD